MNPYSYSKRLSRVYSFDNSQNGGLGPLGFLNNILNPKRVKNNNATIKNDLSIYLLYNDSTTIDNLNLLENSILNLKKYKIKFEKYLINQTNYQTIVNKIKNNNNSKFMIVDKQLINYFYDLKIPFKKYILINETLIDDVITHINNILFNNLYEKKFKI